jgi:hypothetical protein
MALVAWECWGWPAHADGASTSPSTGSTGSAQPALAAPRTTEQPDEAEEHVLIRSKATLGGYGGPDMRVTSLLGDPAMFVGAQASWVAHHQYLFGVAAYGLATRHNSPESMQINGNPSTLGLVYGGIRLGVVAMPTKLLHVTLAVLAGPGSLSGISSVPTRAEFEVGYDRQLGHTETFFVMEPEVAVEANVTSFMRVALGASYRYVTGVQQPGLSAGNLSSPAASLAFKFGAF